MVPRYNPLRRIQWPIGWWTWLKVMQVHSQMFEKKAFVNISNVIWSTDFILGTNLQCHCVLLKIQVMAIWQARQWIPSYLLSQIFVTDLCGTLLFGVGFIAYIKLHNVYDSEYIFFCIFYTQVSFFDLLSLVYLIQSHVSSFECKLNA